MLICRPCDHGLRQVFLLIVQGRRLPHGPGHSGAVTGNWRVPLGPPELGGWGQWEKSRLLIGSGTLLEYLSLFRPQFLSQQNRNNNTLAQKSHWEPHTAAGPAQEAHISAGREWKEVLYQLYTQRKWEAGKTIWARLLGVLYLCASPRHGVVSNPMTARVVGMSVLPSVVSTQEP